MSTIIVAAILLGVITAICLFLISLARKQKRKKMNQFLTHFSRLGTTHNLSFSSHEIRNNILIGLDGLQRKLMVLTQTGDAAYDHFVVDLDDVLSCTLKKYYGNIKPNELRNKSLDSYLERLVLHFERKHGHPNVEVDFYNHFHNNAYHLPEIEQKATHWQQMLTKMLKDRPKKTA